MEEVCTCHNKLDGSAWKVDDLPNSTPMIRCRAPTKTAYSETKESSKFALDEMASKTRSVMVVVTSDVSQETLDWHTISTIISIYLFNSTNDTIHIGLRKPVVSTDSPVCVR
jgi:hypothetical protein